MSTLKEATLKFDDMEDYILEMADNGEHNAKHLYFWQKMLFVQKTFQRFYILQWNFLARLNISKISSYLWEWNDTTES